MTPKPLPTPLRPVRGSRLFSASIAPLRLNYLALPFLVLGVSGCLGPRPQRGGHALTTGAITQTLAQPENPAAPSRQTQDTFRTRTYTLPAGTRIEQTQPLETNAPSSSFILHPSSFTLPTPLLTEYEESHATTELGAAQKDTAREFTAKLSSLKSIVWVGLALFIFGLASLFWPPLQAIVGSVTTSAAITLGGLALIILPTLIVGNELLILGGVAAVVVAWFLAHRHGELRGKLLASGLVAPKRSEGGRHGHLRGQLSTLSDPSVKSVVKTSSPRK